MDTDNSVVTVGREGVEVEEKGIEEGVNGDGKK